MQQHPSSANECQVSPPESAFAGAKERQRDAWSAGDYGVVGTTLQIVGEQLCESLDLRSGERVLDVAAGNGNAALAAARRWCDVTASDYVPELLANASRRAAADRLRIDFREADAEALPFESGSFDVVISTFGVMFTPDQERASAELVRVCRRGGRIGLASWTPDSFVGQLFKTIGRHLPPPPGFRSPTLWGSQPWVASTFGPHATRIDSCQLEFNFRYRSAEHMLEVFRTFYGPVLKAYAQLGAPAQESLTRDFLALIRRFDRSGCGRVVVPGAYLESVVTLKG